MGCVCVDMCIGEEGRTLRQNGSCDHVMARAQFDYFDFDLDIDRLYCHSKAHSQYTIERDYDTRLQENRRRVKPYKYKVVE